MKLEYSIDNAAEIVTISYNGNPEYAEWANMMMEILHDKDFKPGISFILDRHLITMPQKTDYIRSVVDFITEHKANLGKCRWAIVTNDLASFGMMRMAQELGGDAIEQMKAFSNSGDAKRWLKD
jgi:hypothetical protein